LLQDKTFITDCARVVEEILMTERILGENHNAEPAFINSRAFVSVFQIACFPLPEYDDPDPALVTTAKTLLSHFECIVYNVKHGRFDPIMTWDFRSRLLRFVHCYKQSVNVDTPFLMEALVYRDYALQCLDVIDKKGVDELSDILMQDYNQNERSIDLYLGGLGNDSFIFGI